MRGWIIGGFSALALLAVQPAVAAPAGGHAAATCSQVARARAQFATDRQFHQQKLTVLERGMQARRVRYQLRTELLRAQLRKQHQAGVPLKPEQEQALIASEKLARDMDGYSSDEQQQIARSRQALSQLEGDYLQKHGNAWFECPKQAAAGAYTVAQRATP